MSTIFIGAKPLNMEQQLQQLAAEWNAECRRIPEGYWFLPEYMMRIHGIHIDEEANGWRFWREADATTWEDFLLMHMTHRLASQHGQLLEYEAQGTIRLIEPEPHTFSTFDLYAERVLAKESGLVRDMKKNWIYAHRTRYVR
ncbi:hypothetical protein PAESOLCIP111_04101 [Paenibacillus solanacearum]|uniref:Uncharacterized protein n=1 Tax=Paenibacillus solanacearum TaxID=2048548 RepID=A0A916NQQ7_9BACL|nr:hypothetical protein [Paenibacillus solanacearum]CAG7640092.1 hypothetical protein PAESOLCIP111_04101 [Paenibacillus solanacearum]